jgi:toxin ParE1/3/4
MRRFLFSSEALHDLEEIGEYISRDNPEAAARVILDIGDKAAILAEHPGIGRNREEVRPNLRSFPCGNYILFYYPTMDGVEIARVLHGARDIQDLFDMG